MRVTADTNLLVRVTVLDDKIQAETAYAILSNADLVAISLPCLCELVWVLESIYNYSPAQIGNAVRSIMAAPNVVIDDAAVETGLRVQAAGGDFADGVIAKAGAAMGGETFVSFDRRAVSRIASLGLASANASALQ